MKITPKRANMHKIHTLNQKSKIDLANKNKKYKVDALLKEATLRARSKAATKGNTKKVAKANLNARSILDFKLQLMKNRSGISLLTGQTSMPDISQLYMKNFPQK